MSDSRLEKFIYAICSMDVTDLPVPLSRIEKIWNCLITGETPDFEPLSRNEKYLMAMLDRYDISNLPAPMSRGEKLLYKIAVGETDLSDVPGYLSRYEELLKYLIENGGISGGDFEYVLYTLNQSLSTLYQTVEKPVKSAILKGQTLVNHTTDNLYITVAPLGVETITENMLALKNNTEYIAIFRMLIGSDTSVYLHLFNNNWVFVKNFSSNLSPTKNYIKFTTPSSSEIKHLQLENKGASSFDITDMMVIEYEDGMENWDIPYFEGMQSVKMPVLTTTGKNLFDSNDFINKLSLTHANDEITFDNKSANKIYYFNINHYPLYFSCELVTPNTAGSSTIQFVFKDGTSKHLAMNTSNNSNYLIEKELDYLIINKWGSDVTIKNIQLEYGSTRTTYEPYKSNILTTPEDLELRGIGNVKDELNLMTGEVVQKIGEIVLDGSESWVQRGEILTNTIPFATPIKVANNGTNIMCDKFKNSTGWSLDEERIWVDNTALQLHISKTKATNINELKTWLSNNNVRVNFKAPQESIKTVDLTTVDQDGQPTKLKTFNDITHVEINADNIIPSVDVEVATKINEALSTMGPQQLNISNTQNKLGQAIDEQTENTDAAMIATTEIYEQTL